MTLFLLCLTTLIFFFFFFPQLPDYNGFNAYSFCGSKEWSSKMSDDLWLLTIHHLWQHIHASSKNKFTFCPNTGNINILLISFTPKTQRTLHGPTHGLFNIFYRIKEKATLGIWATQHIKMRQISTKSGMSQVGIKQILTRTPPQQVIPVHPGIKLLTLPALGEEGRTRCKGWLHFTGPY